MSDGPLVSFVLFAYNQERFIREAVEGALSQTYRPLEIILSDDYSSDRTFQIMQELAAAYKGPHKVVLNRNASNLGVAEHVNRLMELSAGSLVVVAAGDDVSHPQRVRYLCEEWLRQKQSPTSIHSDYEVMDDQGRLVKDNQKRNDYAGKGSAGLGEIRGFLRGTNQAGHIHGATHAFSPVLFKEFGPLNMDVVFEDKVLGFRSLLYGSFAYVPRKLVRYRMHASNLWGRRADPRASRYERVRQGIAQEAVHNHRWVAVLNNYRDDMHMFMSRGGCTHADGVAVLREIDRCLKVKVCEYRIYASPPWVALLALLHRLLLRPQWRYGWPAAKHLLFRTADSAGLLPKQ